MHRGQADGKTFDAIVIGARPDGPTAAHVLVSRGHAVLLLDQCAFPRFHIGESMVPYLTRAFEKMGVLDQFQGKFMPKRGGEIGRAHPVGNTAALADAGRAHGRDRRRHWGSDAEDSCSGGMGKKEDKGRSRKRRIPYPVSRQNQKSSPPLQNQLTSGKE